MVLIVFSGIYSSANAQSATYSFSFKNAALDKVIEEIAKQSGYQFIFDASYLQKSSPTTLEIKSADIKEVLNTVFKTQNFSYEISGKTIILKPVPANLTEGTYYQVKGRVIDSIGVSIPGVVVRVKGQRESVQTDTDGNFMVAVKEPNHTLLFNYIGYKEEEYVAVPSVAFTSITIVLKPNTSMLQEVFVNGFQKISKERSTAAYTNVSNEDLNRNLNVDLISALEGKVAGLITIKNPTGKSADKLLLRGISTYSSTVGTQPLLVIDGLPTEYTLDEVNPYDIESVTVLKDAAAASIYGARSANGVIIMTTKQAKGKGLEINLNADLFITGKSDVSKMHYAATSDLIDWETAVYKKTLSGFSNVESMFDGYGKLTNGTLKYYSPLYQLYRSQASGALTADQVNSTLGQWRQNDYIKDYRENVWQNEIRQRYNLSLGSSTDKSNTYLSLNYDQGKGRVINNMNRAFNLNMKSTFRVKSWLNATIGLNGKYANDETTGIEYDNMFLQERYARIVDADGNKVLSDYVNLSDGFSSSSAINGAVINAIAGNAAFKPFNFNLIDALADGIDKQKYLNLRAFSNIEAKLYKGLTFNTQVQYETSSTKLDRYHAVDGYRMRYMSNMFIDKSMTSHLDAGGRYYQLDKSSNNYTFRNQLNFNRGFGKNENEHYVAAIAGFEMRQTFSPVSNESLHFGYDPQTIQFVNLDDDVLVDGIASYFNGNRTIGRLGTSQMERRHRYTSRYANMSYTFQGKYNATASVRMDNSDLFGVDYKDKNRPFWSAGLAWNASSEEFLKKLSWLNTLKLRATYGTNGNVDQSTTSFIVANRKKDALLTNLNYWNITTMPNPTLRWETTATTNFGIDYAVFGNRLRGSIDVYNRKSTDLLNTTKLDPTVGTLAQVVNSGSLRNRGIEFSASGDWFKTKDWTFTTNVTFAMNKNEVVKVNNPQTSIGVYVTAPNTFFIAGDAFNSLYAYKYGGMVNGYPYVLDENGNPNVTFDASGSPTAVRQINNLNALVKVGQLDPKYSGSVSQRISYQGFELSTMFIFSGGNKLRKDVSALDASDLKDIDVANRWTETSDLPRLFVDYATNQNSNMQTLSTLWKYSDKQILDASYVKLRNIALSYNLPRTVSRKLGVASFRITGQVNNLWYWSAAGDDIDPEAYSLNSGVRSFAIPKSFLLGLNVTF
ncbi:SusC/RagA family TonB-linked outer membrane protein [Pedobacter sp. N36a]|uniref:SusC/RagA family TonB-linked outer membrane protein n=1 Tax=Pedobacter sp. N36a TaxID=2767996 RepID=UPI0021024C40|nr:SusC/RagA family TonB-linked outer membrane protein [Pedobacter sp. N36a]